MANMTLKRNPMPTQDAAVRARNFDEVALGYDEATAIDEANRCLNWKILKMGSFGTIRQGTLKR